MKQAMQLFLLLSFVVCGGLLISSPSIAKDKSVQISAKQSTKDVLDIAQKNNLHVYVDLAGGQQYSAKVKEVSTHAVLLKNPTGKDFYEVYIPMSAISAISVRVRAR